MSGFYSSLTFLLLAFVVSAGAQRTKAKQSETIPETSLADQVATAKPSILKIASPAGTGTGVIINDRGVVITARHVVCCVAGTQNAFAEVELQWIIPTQDNELDGVESGNTVGTPATVLDVDAVNDLAILVPKLDFMHIDFVKMMKLDTIFPKAKETTKSAAKLQQEPLREGDPIFISGYPLNFGALITTSGSIASSEPTAEGHTLKDVYWADIHANHGNSGGPVFSMKTGKVIGIQAAISLTQVENDASRKLAYNSGIAYIIPIKYAVNLLKKNRIPFEQ